jgi:GT2 family glycosyltransferase
MTKRVFDLICPWDEQFNMYYQDNDYARKIESKGIKHALVRHSIVSHIKSLDVLKLNPDTDNKMEEGRQKFIKKWNIK